MTHRIRHAMEFTDSTLLGAGGEVIEADETYIGRQTGVKKAKAGRAHKRKVFALVERGGKVKSAHVSGSMFDGIKEGLKHVSPDANLVTDESTMYRKVGKAFASHETVNHSIKEWKRGNAHTNTIESYFSVFKRGMRGVYQHCREDHLHRYLSEFDFRHNHRSALEINDVQRAEKILEGVGGKRLTYR